VATPDNFGRSGARPTHPELLDWLATEFVRSGWSVKALHRLILTSAVYRQASAAPPAAAGRPDPAAIDPGNQLLWRQRLRRVESEVVRDAVLAVSGALNPAMGGPPVPLEPRKDGSVVVAMSKLASPADADRRSVYLLCRRNYHLSVLNVFDQPVVATNCTRRAASAVPIQSLAQLNDAFFLGQAERFARRVADEAGPSPGARIERAFRRALGRCPKPAEAAWAAALLGRQARRYAAQKLPADQAALEALAQVCHVLLCTNEFLYVE
jgi:hypothetical protein